jgi:hypothetical protein
MQPKPLTKMTVHELRGLANARGIPGRSEMKKADLIDALQEQTLQDQIDDLKRRVTALEGGEE